MTEPDSIAIVLVNYHKADRVIDNIAALRKQSIAGELDVVVVDNSVSARQVELLESATSDGFARIVVAPNNLGYSRGVNLGARSMPAGRHVLLLNPDIVVDDPNALSTLRDVLEQDSRIGVLGTMQRNDDGSLVEVARRFPKFPRLVLRRLRPGKFTDYDLLHPLVEAPDHPPLDVDWVQSSFTLVRNTVWAQLGGLDELYRIFMSDVALCAAATGLGYRVAVTPSVCVRADGLRASRGGVRALFSNRALRIHVADAILYQLSFLLTPLRQIIRRSRR